jgi:hypothetical protein
MCEFNASLGGGAAVDERNTHRARARSTRTARNMVRQCDLRGEKQTRHGERGGATRSTAHGCVSDGGCASLYRSSDHKARNMVRTTTSGAREANPVRKPRRKFVLLESPRKQPYEPLTNATMAASPLDGARIRSSEVTIVARSLKSTVCMGLCSRRVCWWIGRTPPERDTSNKKNQRDTVGHRGDSQEV